MTAWSLIDGPVPILIGIAAFTTLAAAMRGGTRRWCATVAAIAVAAAVVSVIGGVASGIEHEVGSSFPKSFFAWAALPLFAAGVAVAGWRRGGRRRAVSLASVVLLALFGADQVNAHYAYLPTVGDAIGRPLPGQVSAGALVALRPTSRPVAEHDGVVVPLEIPGTVSHFRARGAFVWLPPAYFAPTHPELPVVLLLAGVPGDPSNMLRAGRAGRFAASYAHHHGGLAPILVFPDQNGAFTRDTECVDGPRGNAETYLTVDVPRDIAHRFGATTDPARWAIVGFSEGGTCALTLALAHPDRFGSFVDIAGDLGPNAASGPDAVRRTIERLYGGDAAEWSAHDPSTLLRSDAARRVSGRIVAGLADHRAAEAGRALVEVAQRSCVALRLESVPGAHSYAVVVRALQLELPRLADQLLGASSVAPATASRTSTSFVGPSTSVSTRLSSMTHQATAPTSAPTIGKTMNAHSCSSASPPA
jgi:S-formylglutathione hydrolase FrmB